MIKFRTTLNTYGPCCTYAHTNTYRWFVGFSQLSLLQLFTSIVFVCDERVALGWRKYLQ